MIIAAILNFPVVHKTGAGQYMNFPTGHWRKIRTNNAMERVNREIRRRTKSISVFPDGASALMLVCAKLRYVANSRWGCKNYMNMNHLNEIADESYEYIGCDLLPKN